LGWSDGLEFELEVALPAEGAEESKARRLALRRREARVPEAALTAGRCDETQPRFVEIDQCLAVGARDDGAHRHREHELFTVVATAVVAHPGAAGAARPVWAAVVAEQGGDLRVGDKHDVATVTAVAAIRAGERLELLTADGHATVPTMTGTKVKRHLVDEVRHGRSPFGGSVLRGENEQRKGEPKPALPEVSRADYAAGTMLTTLRPPFVPNCTAPADRANNVSSPPRPTLTPGWK